MKAFTTTFNGLRLCVLNVSEKIYDIQQSIKLYLCTYKLLFHYKMLLKWSKGKN